MVGLIGNWASTAFRLSMPFRDVSVGACLGMNSLGKYSFARHRQEARPGSARGLMARRQQSLCGLAPGGTSSRLPHCRDGVDRAGADAEIGAMFLLGCPASTRSKISRWRLVRLATHVGAISPNLHSAAA